MTSSALLIALLVLATVLGGWRLRHATSGWRRSLLLALQPLCAALLYFALMPPSQPGSPKAIVVLTAGSDLQATRAAQARVVALPEAKAPAEIEQVPDLATALRRHPGSTTLHIVGNGLRARDRQSASGRALTFDATAETSGLAELSDPPLQVPGAAFHVIGRVASVANARVELLDPAGKRVDAGKADQAGRFTLQGSSRAAGSVEFQLRVLDGAGQQRDAAAVPVLTVAPPTQRILMLGGAPQPEWKYLRRWADEAGLQTQARFAVGGGVQLGDSSIRLGTENLDKLDLAVIDERALAALSRAQRRALADAVKRGLGVLVRVTGTLDTAERSALADFGFALQGSAEAGAVPVEVPHAQDADDASAQDQTTAALQHLAWHPAAPDTPVLSRDGNGTPYAWWRPQGKGRVGVTTLIDSYRLVLEGNADAHAARWSTTLSMLARPQAAQTRLAETAWQGERTPLCNLNGASGVILPDGGSLPLLTNEAGCAALWPRQVGWHHWQGSNHRSGALYVRPTEHASALHQNTIRRQTLALVRSDARTQAGSATPQPGNRWPWWAAFVIAAALSWWLERRRPS